MAVSKAHSDSNGKQMGSFQAFLLIPQASCLRVGVRTGGNNWLPAVQPCVTRNLA